MQAKNGKDNVSEALAQLRGQRAEVTAWIERETAALTKGFDLMNPLASLAPRAKREAELSSARSLLSEIDARIVEFARQVATEEHAAREARLIELHKAEALQAEAVRQVFERMTAEVAVEVNRFDQIMREIKSLGSDAFTKVHPVVYSLPARVAEWQGWVRDGKRDRKKELAEELNRELKARIEIYHTAEQGHDMPCLGSHQTQADRMSFARATVLAMAEHIERVTGQFPAIPFPRPAVPKIEPLPESNSGERNLVLV